MPAPGAAAAVKALFGSFTQASRLLQLTTPAGQNQLLAESVRAVEGLSEGFALHVTALSTDARIPLKSLVGQPVLLELLTARSGVRRPFHGHVTRIEMSGANGGFARYRLTVEPWTSFLAHTRDSRIFQDASVVDIIDRVFARYQAKGTLTPAWRFDLLERAAYPRRSHATQYQESDLAFVQRLMAEEGLFYFFLHTRERHELVIADHNGAFAPNAQDTIRFTQPGAVMKEDSMDRWRSAASIGATSIELASWDYRTIGMRPVSAGALDAGDIALASRDVPGVYAYSSQEHGKRIVTRQMEALEASRATCSGEGTVRTLTPGTTFTLADHALLDAGDADGRRFLAVRVTHTMHNNLRAEMGAAARAALGRSPLDSADDDDAERRLYRNEVAAIRSSVAYRSGARYPRPSAGGQQSAIVVGPAGAMVHTDRDHRIKVQFHWQRGDRSHSRLGHPAPSGHAGAPSDDRAGSWVRVASPLAAMAGANWGGNAVPRVGQEVLVDFLEDDIDRPVVVGALYNGQGQRDAQHNQFSFGAGAATGNAPAWFPGESGAHAHPAALSGIKSQAMSASQRGAGAYGQLVFDDSPGQARIALQQHASAHRGTAELNLGYLQHQSDNQRLQTVGLGAELKTDGAAALRAGQGMLLSADARNGATGGQLDSREALMQVEQSHHLQLSLAKTAQAHNAKFEGDAEPEKLAAIAQLDHAAHVLKAVGEREVAEYSEPWLQVSAPAGIAAATPGDAIVSAGATTSITAGQDINFASQRGAFYAVKDGISLFTYGKASNKDKPNQETGIRLHAASGKVSSQSQSGETRLTADKMVTVASIAQSVTVGAKEHVLMTAQGAYLKIEGGNIMLHCPGKVEFKAGKKELAGPKSSSMDTTPLPKVSYKGCQQATSNASARQAGAQTL